MLTKKKELYTGAIEWICGTMFIQSFLSACQLGGTLAVGDCEFELCNVDSGCEISESTNSMAIGHCNIDISDVVGY